MSVCVCVCVCVCARARARRRERLDIRNTLLRNDLRKSYDKRLSQSEAWNVPENEVWSRNKDARKQDLCAGSVPECDGWVHMVSEICKWIDRTSAGK